MLWKWPVSARRSIHDDGGDKANLLAVIGPDVEGGVVLSGHTDVVPVEGQAWDSDPFTLREADGRLYGRGSSDMKGFIACCMAAVPALVSAARDGKLERPVTFAPSRMMKKSAVSARRA